MAIFFQSNENEKIDIGNIPNFDYLLKNLQSRKSYPIIFHIVYALLCAMCTFVAVNGLCANISPVLSAICMCLAPALLTYTFLYSPTWIKAASLILPALSYIFLHIQKKTDYLHASGHILMFLLIICAAVFFTKTSICGYKKSTCFLIITCVYAVITLASFAILLVYNKGSVSPIEAVKALDETADVLINAIIKEISNEKDLLELRQILPNANNMTDSELLSMAKSALEQAVTLTKLILPAIVILTCMFQAFITVEIFAFVAKKMNIDLFVCVMDSKWVYRPSKVTATFYDIVFFAYVISMFVAFPPNIIMTIENLILILAPAMSVMGINGIYKFFCKKINKKGICVVICSAIVLYLLSFMGTLGILLIGSLGVMFITMRDRNEWELYTHSTIAMENLQKKALYMTAVTEKNNPFNENKPE